MQVIWKGAISFGLVSIPVRLFAAIEERRVSFRQIHARDGGRIRYRRVCEVDDEEVTFDDIAKGYELPSGEVVTFTEEDFAELPLPSRRSIEVLSFVEAGSLDPVQLTRCYFCEPTDTDTKPYALLRESLVRTGKVAVVKVTLRQRESLAVLRPREGVLVLQLMLWPDEVRQPSFPFLEDDARLPRHELAMAESYVEALTGEVDAEEMVDSYRIALHELAEAKATGQEIARPTATPPAAPATVDLMDALQRSIDEAKRGRGEEPPDAKGTARKSTKPAAKPAAKKSAKKAATPAKEAAKKAAEKQPAGGKNAKRRTRKSSV
jgi:DNA end-binding protein Ku